MPKKYTAPICESAMVAILTKKAIFDAKISQTKGSAMALNNTGGSKASASLAFSPTFSLLHSSLVAMLAKKVARVPKSISYHPKGLSTLARAQPKVRPSIASGIKIGNIVSASATLNCNGPKLIGCKKYVKVK